MRRIYYVIAVLACILCFYLGYRVNSETLDAHGLAVLRAKNDSIDKVLRIEYYYNQRAKDTISRQKAIIAGIDRARQHEEQLLVDIRAEFRALSARFNNSSLKTLDSLRWAWYPDSITVLQRKR